MQLFIAEKPDFPKAIVEGGGRENMVVVASQSVKRII